MKHPTSLRNRLAEALIVLCTMLLPGFAGQAAGQACSGPCSCNDCCAYLLRYTIHCSAAPCYIWVCMPNGIEGGDTAAGTCPCCGVLSYEFDGGTRVVAGPSQSNAGEVGSTELVFIRGCDGQYAIVRVGQVG
jgi:hypothetical protein